MEIALLIVALLIITAAGAFTYAFYPEGKHPDGDEDEED